MVITIDIGNTDVVSVLYNNDSTTERFQRISLEASKLKENTDIFVMDLIRTWHIEDVDYIVSCVVPSISADLKNSFDKYFTGKGSFVDYKSYPAVSEDLKYPAEIGADLISASVAVIDESKPTIIVDMGSATKVILVKDNRLDSVAILLGVKNNMQALNQSIKHLPSVELQFTKDVLGKDTIESIQSGLMYSTLFSVQGFVSKLESQYGPDINKVLTGGIGNLFKDHLSDFSHMPNLVNEGLFKIYLRSKESL